jgi:hypothetical protein
LAMVDPVEEPEDDHAVAVPRHGDTPDKINNSRQTQPGRLNAKVRAPMFTGRRNRRDQRKR